MPRRATPKLTSARRAALETELRLLQLLEERAKLDKYVHVSMAFDAGMTVRDLADVFGTSSSTATTWKAQGEQERERRRGEDPGGSEQRRQIG